MENAADKGVLLFPSDSLPVMKDEKMKNWLSWLSGEKCIRKHQIEAAKPFENIAVAS